MKNQPADTEGPLKDFPNNKPTVGFHRAVGIILISKYFLTKKGASCPWEDGHFPRPSSSLCHPPLCFPGPLFSSDCSSDTSSVQVLTEGLGQEERWSLAWGPGHTQGGREAPGSTTRAVLCRSTKGRPVPAVWEAAPKTGVSARFSRRRRLRWAKEVEATGQALSRKQEKCETE